MASSSSTTTITNRAQPGIVNTLFSYFQIPKLDPIEDTRRSLLQLTERYGSTHPSFRQGTYNEAISFSKSKFKFLLVFIHSPRNNDSHQFCKDIMFTREFKEFIDSHFVIWTCTVNTSSGMKISNDLRVTTYPYLGMYSCNNITGFVNSSQPLFESSGSQLSSLGRDALIQSMTASLTSFEPYLIVAKSEQEQREQDRFIMQEQDEAYLASLAKDQEKERLERERQEREREEREREEREEQERLRAEADLQLRKQEKAKLFSTEPTKSDLTSRVLIKLSDGSRIQRNFLRTDSISHILDYVDTQINEPVDNFDLMTSFPKKVLKDLSRTIGEEGLFPDTCLLLTDK